MVMQVPRRLQGGTVMTPPIERTRALRWHGLLQPIAELMDCLAGGYEPVRNGCAAGSRI